MEEIAKCEVPDAWARVEQQCQLRVAPQLVCDLGIRSSSEVPSPLAPWLRALGVAGGVVAWIWMVYSHSRLSGSQPPAPRLVGSLPVRVGRQSLPESPALRHGQPPARSACSPAKYAVAPPRRAAAPGSPARAPFPARTDPGRSPPSWSSPPGR